MSQIILTAALILLPILVTFGHWLPPVGPCHQLAPATPGSNYYHCIQVFQLGHGSSHYRGLVIREEYPKSSSGCWGSTHTFIAQRIGPFQDRWVGLQWQSHAKFLCISSPTLNKERLSIFNSLRVHHQLLVHVSANQLHNLLKPFLTSQAPTLNAESLLRGPV